MCQRFNASLPCGTNVKSRHVKARSSRDVLNVSTGMRLRHVPSSSLATPARSLSHASTLCKPFNSGASSPGTPRSPLAKGAFWHVAQKGAGTVGPFKPATFLSQWQGTKAYHVRCLAGMDCHARLRVAQRGMAAWDGMKEGSISCWRRQRWIMDFGRPLHIQLHLFAGRNHFADSSPIDKTFVRSFATHDRSIRLHHSRRTSSPSVDQHFTRPTRPTTTHHALLNSPPNPPRHHNDPSPLSSPPNFQ